MPARLSRTLVACASVLALTACRDDAPPAPAAYDFANAPPAVIDASVPALYAGYAPAERAYAFDRVTYRTAPSYGFRYGEDEPWAWRTSDDYSMYAEPYDDGYRNYYYAPGADYPYFVRDDDYGYGYGPDGALVAVYDSYGELLPQDSLHALAALAGVYLVRASAIRRYGLDDRYRVVVTEDYWSARAPRYYEIQQVWYTAPDRQPRWRAWRASHQTEVAPLLPRGEVRRWSKGDERAWKIDERADRKAWQAEDRAWRKAQRGADRQVASAAAPRAAVLREDQRDRAIGPRADRGPDRQAAIEPPRERENGRRGGPDRVEMATAGPRSVQDDHRERPKGPERAAVRGERRGGGRPAQIAAANADQRPRADVRHEAPATPRTEPPARAERGRGGDRREAQVATARPPRPQAAPRREPANGRHAEARQQPAPAQASPQPPRGQDHGGRPERGPDRAAAPAPQAAAAHPQGGKGGGAGKSNGKGRDKDKR